MIVESLATGFMTIVYDILQFATEELTFFSNPYLCILFFFPTLLSLLQLIHIALMCLWRLTMTRLHWLEILLSTSRHNAVVSEIALQIATQAVRLWKDILPIYLSVCPFSRPAHPCRLRWLTEEFLLQVMTCH